MAGEHDRDVDCASYATRLERDDAPLKQIVQDAQSIHPWHPAHIDDGFEGGNSVDER